MLWNVEKGKSKSCDGEKLSISVTTNEASTKDKKLQGYAMKIKDEYLEGTSDCKLI